VSSGLVNTGFCFSVELYLQESRHYYVCAFQHTNHYIIQNQYFNHKETIIHGHDHPNATILSVIHNMSTTCFGQYYFWPSSGWIQLSEKTTQYNMIVYNHQFYCFLMF